MSLASEIGRYRTAQEATKGAQDFAKLAHAILRNSGSITNLMDAVDKPGTFDGGLDRDLAAIVKNAGPF